MRLAPLLLLLCVAAAARAQSPDTARVDPVIVTATRTPLTRGSLPVAVTVISGDELRRAGLATVGEALATVTSAYVARAGSLGATTSLFLRGGESKYVKVLVDGVPANEPGGVYDFASLTTDNVERIEVVRGPASVIHGADAVTGVVHVITRGGPADHDGARVEVETRFGSAPRDRLASNADPGDVWMSDIGVRAGDAFRRGSYSLGVASHRSSGLYALNNAYRNHVVSGRVELRPGRATTFRAAVRYNDHRYAYPTSSGGAPVDSNAFRAEDRAVVALEANRAWSARVRSALLLDATLNDGRTDDRPDAPGGDSYVSDDRTHRRGGEVRVQWLGAATSASAGLRLERQETRSDSRSESAFGTFESSFRAARWNRGVYGEVVVAPAANLTATLGGRMDDNQKFGRFVTGRAGLSWRPTAAARLRATLGNAFREPSFFENYESAFARGNPDLKPERTVSADAGLDVELPGGRASASVSVFAQRFQDMIDYTWGLAACGYNYCNVAAARADGLELEVRGRLHPRLTTSVGATWLRTEVLEPGFDSLDGGLYQRGESLLRRPARTLTGELTYDDGPLSLSARLAAVGRRDDRYFTPAFEQVRTTLAAYERLDVSGGYRFTRALTGTLRLENATNTGYQAVYGFLSPRRTIALGLRAVW